MTNNFEISNVIKDANDQDLFLIFSETMREMKRRNLIRTWNNPVADYGESLAAKMLSLELEPCSNTGYDGEDPDGKKYEIKSRRRIGKRRLQLSAIRNIEKDHFDYLVIVILTANFSLEAMYKIPRAVVKEVARFQEHTKSWVLYADDRLFGRPDIEKIA